MNNIMFGWLVGHFTKNLIWYLKLHWKNNDYDCVEMKSEKCAFSSCLSVRVYLFALFRWSNWFCVCTWLSADIVAYMSYLVKLTIFPKTPSVEKIYVDYLLRSVTIFQQRIDRIFRRIRNSWEMLCKMAMETWMYVIFIRSRCVTLRFLFRLLRLKRLVAIWWILFSEFVA